MKTNNVFNIILSFCLLCLCSCETTPELYKKEFSQEELAKLPEQMMEKVIRKYGQGSVSEIMVLKEVEKLDPQNATLWREFGVPYGKRGMAKEYYENYGKAVEYDPLHWQGWRGYMYLYFYRDYQKALDDFNALDTLTPNFVDYPQATSIHFMRGVCHLQMEEYDQAISYWEKHFAEELKTLTPDYLDSKSFLFYGITHYKMGNLEKAKEQFNLGIEHNPRDADLLFWYARTAFELKDYYEANKAINAADKAFKKGNFNQRPYVEEFYQIYQGDIDELSDKVYNRKDNLEG